MILVLRKASKIAESWIFFLEMKYYVGGGTVCSFESKNIKQLN